MRLMAFVFVTCVIFTRPAIAQSQEEDQPEANPGRPTVSTPATLTPVGYLQFESGFTRDSKLMREAVHYKVNSQRVRSEINGDFIKKKPLAKKKQTQPKGTTTPEKKD